MDPRAATIFGLVLGIAATLWLGTFVNWLSAGAGAGRERVLHLVYTLWLKRRTPQNIIWGGIAGCFPPLIGWTAVTGSVSVVPLVLFAIVFFWTPPHTWALAMRYREDYAAADVPMLPVVRSAPVVARQIMLYAVLTVACSLLLWPVADSAGLPDRGAAGRCRAALGVGSAVVASRAGPDRCRAQADASVPLVQLLPRAGLRGRRAVDPAAALRSAVMASRSSCCSTTRRMPQIRAQWDRLGDAGLPTARRTNPARTTLPTSLCGRGAGSARRPRSGCRRCSPVSTSNW